jgi:acetate kinase
MILCVNAGSSSLKLAMFDGERRVASTTVERIGTDVAAALGAALDEASFGTPAAVGHRVVQGGPDHMAPERVTPAVLADLCAAVPLAPLHLPATLACIEAIGARHPDVPQVVCFDTAFHRTMPAVSRRLPLPRALHDRGIRRYGFHGLSYEYVVATVGVTALGRAVIAHLGNGASMVAVRDGASVDTTMGFTPTGGFMMGTRSGDLDPGVLVHLMTHEGRDAAAIERLVDREAGLLGVSGSSADMRTLLERRATDPAAADAVELYCHQLRKQIGALAAVLGGLDTLVFTGGIGEHAAPVRAEACAGLEHVGIRVDPERNARHDAVISTSDAACTVRVVPTDEDRMIARHTRAVLQRT